MELRALEHFEAVARHEHVGRAAEELLVAQPSLSRSLARLESELGVQLFDRVGRGLVLNRFGYTYAQRVRRVLTELEDAARELDDLAGEQAGRVAIASETVLTLSGMLPSLRAAHPDLDVRLFQASLAGSLELLGTGEVDLALVSQAVADGAFDVHRLGTEQVFVTVAPDHPLSGRSQVGVADLIDEPAVTTRQGFWQRTLLDELFARHGRRARVVCEGDEPGATQDLVAAGLGFGLLPAIARAAPQRPRLAWLELDEPGCERTLSVVRDPRRYRTEAQRTFVGALVAAFG